MRLNNLLPALLVTSLAACLPGQIISQPIAVHLTNAGHKAHVVDTIPVTIRVYIRAGEKGMRINELSGVPCQVSSQYFTAQVRSPSVVNIPTFDALVPKAPKARVNPGATFICTLNGVVRKASGGGCVQMDGAGTNACKPATASIIFEK